MRVAPVLKGQGGLEARPSVAGNVSSGRKPVSESRIFVGPLSFA
jgi:hypothetical protein